MIGSVTSRMLQDITSQLPSTPNQSTSQVPANQRLDVGADPDANAARVLRAQWERYQQMYTPVEDRMIGSIGENTTYQAAGDARDASLRADGVADRMQSRMGLADIQGAPTQARRQRANYLAQTEAFNNTALAQIDRDQAVRTGLVDLGQGLVNQATGGLVDAAGMAGNRDTAHTQAMAQWRSNRDNNISQTLQTAGMAAALFAI